MFNHYKTKNNLLDKDSDSGHQALFLEESHNKILYDKQSLLKILNHNKEQLNFRELFWVDNFKEIDENIFDKFVWTPQEHLKLNFLKTDLERSRYILYRFAYKYFPINYITDTAPLQILIEPTSVCNLRCPMCFQSDKSFTVREYMGKMNLELFEKIWKQINEYCIPAVGFGSRGESFIHSNFDDIMDIVSNKKHSQLHDLKINTNATRLNEKRIRKLFDSGFNSIVVSADSENKSLYEEFRKGAKFEEVVENVSLLKHIRDTEYSNKGIEIRVSGVCVDNRQKPKPFYDFWSKYSDNVVYVKPIERWNTYKNKLRTDQMDPCTFLWEKMFIWHDGVVNTCDEDYKSYLSPGNIMEKNILELWNSNDMKNKRKIHLENKRNALEPCNRCSS